MFVPEPARVLSAFLSSSRQTRTLRGFEKRSRERAAHLIYSLIYLLTH